MANTSVSNAALHEVTGPLDSARVSLEFDHVLASLGVLEPHDATAVSYTHLTLPTILLV